MYTFLDGVAPFSQNGRRENISWFFLNEWKRSYIVVFSTPWQKRKKRRFSAVAGQNARILQASTCYFRWPAPRSDWKGFFSSYFARHYHWRSHIWSRGSLLHIAYAVCTWILFRNVGISVAVVIITTVLPSLSHISRVKFHSPRHLPHAYDFLPIVFLFVSFSFFMSFLMKWGFTLGSFTVLRLDKLLFFVCLFSYFCSIKIPCQMLQ